MTKREIVVLPPTPENIERARFMDYNRYKIDSDSRQRRSNHFKPIYYLKRQDRFYVNMYLGHWRRFVTGVMTEDGEPTICFGLVLGQTEMKRSK